MMTLGTGLGGGIVANGKPIEGAFGAGGELGHIVVDLHNGRQCNCGNKGCLETIASATGIVREFKDLRQDLALPSILDKLDNVSAKDILDAAQQEDQLALNVVDNVAFYLGYACHIISVTTNPEVILIGGGVSKAGKFLLYKIIDEFNKYKFDAVKDTQIVLAELGNDAGMYGAALLVLNA
jgi:glucokinase